MDTGFRHEGLIGLNPGEILRLRNAAGRHIGVVRGAVWVTQHADPGDRVLGSGESFRFDRDGLALATPLGGAAKFVLEEGLAPERSVEPHEIGVARDPWSHHTPAFERAARRMRAEAIAKALAALGGGVKALWGRLSRTFSAARQERQTARELGALSDHILKDIGLRRDQIACAARQYPC